MVRHIPIELLDKPCVLSGRSVIATFSETNRDGEYPSMVVLLRSETGVIFAPGAHYSTHVAYYVDDQADGGRWELTSGNYDLTYERGVADFARRAGVG